MVSSTVNTSASAVSNQQYEQNIIPSVANVWHNTTARCGRASHGWRLSVENISARSPCGLVCRHSSRRDDELVYVEFIVVISSDEKGGLRGRGSIDADGRMRERFSNNVHRRRYGNFQPDGNIMWDDVGQSWTYGISDGNAGQLLRRSSHSTFKSFI